MRAAILSAMALVLVSSACTSDEPDVEVCESVMACVIESECVTDPALNAAVQDCAAQYDCADTPAPCGWDAPECADVRATYEAAGAATEDCVDSCFDPAWREDNTSQEYEDSTFGRFRGLGCNLLSFYGDQLTDDQLAAHQEACSAGCDYVCPNGSQVC